MAVFHRLAVAIAVVAMGWQLYNLAVAKLAANSKATVNTAKLVDDLKSGDYKVVHAALSSIYMLSGVGETAPQLLQAGIQKQLVGLVTSASLKDTANEILPLSLLSLAQLVKQRPAVAEQVLAAGMPEQLVKVAKTGVPGWLACVSQLLYSFCESETPQCAVAGQQVLSHKEVLVPGLLGLLETGAVSNHTDAMIAGSRLLHLMVRHTPEAVQKAVAEQLKKKGAVRLVVQVITAEKRDSRVLAAAAEALSTLVDAHTPALGLLAEQPTLVTTLLQELRVSNKRSFSTVLGLLGRLVHEESLQAEAVSSGALSLCGQVLFQTSSEQWRQQCVSLLCDVAKEDVTDSQGQVPRQREKQQAVGVGCLMAMVTQTSNIPLHGSALEALRDMATSRTACQEMVNQGVLDHVTVLLAGDVPRSAQAAREWLMQTQRGAAALVALLALQPPLRHQLVEAGVIEALAACIRNHASGAGLDAQLRVTAAAALVPILNSKDNQFDARVVKSGVIEDVMQMLVTSTAEAEQQVATKVLSLLNRHIQTKDL